MSEKNSKHHDQDERIIRLKKLELLKSTTDFPYRFDRTHTNLDIITNFDELHKQNSTVRVAGRIFSIREHGKTKFVDLYDQTGKVQLYFRKDILSDLYDKLELIDIGDLIGVTGEVFKTKAGEITILVKSYQILNKSLRPLPEKWHGLTDIETRYRQRYLDLMANPETKRIILMRSEIIRLMRKFFEERGFIEIETPILQPIYGGASAKPFETYYNVLEEKMFLRISDELYLKRLIIGGIEKVFEIGKDFRNEGVDRFHNPEFTQLEAYEAYKDYNDMMLLVEELFRFLTYSLYQTYKITYTYEYKTEEIELDGKKQTVKIPLNHELDFSKPWRKIKFCDALNEKLGFNILEASYEQLKKRALEVGILEKETSQEPDIVKLIDKLFSHLVQKNILDPTFVIDYPKITTPLARTHRENSLLVERFEPIICRIEIGNAFSELNDPIEQRQRFEDQLKRQEKYATLDADFITALEYGMPPTAGIGLGIDRIVMILTNAESIREVIPFPQLKPLKG
ncbi:MAG: lysine--tRNA ligase [candidate division WOR-3 bacterium]|nr:lysine--tRNA ligase [candidate division WOR-3 bacterium]MDW7988057.1 lysine--tRNA ligase [candidate division WOR-3 bacterium]